MRFQRPGIHQGCVSSRRRSGTAGLVLSVVTVYVQNTLCPVSSDRGDRRQVPSGAKIAPDCAEDQPPAAASLWVWSGRTAPRAWSPQKRLTSFEAESISDCLDESISQSSETGECRNHIHCQPEPANKGDVVRPAHSRLVSSAGGILRWEGK